MKVPPDAAGERLDVFLARARRLPREGAGVDRRRAWCASTACPKPKRHVLGGGETIDVAPEPAVEREPVPDAQFAIAYEDEHLIVVNKPAGVVVHPGHGQRRGHARAGAGAAAWPAGRTPTRPGVVHRLDRDTSGLLVLARDDETLHARSQAALRAREITREYLALVEGRPPARRGTIDAPLGRDRRTRTKISTDTDDPHPAVTHFETERTLPEDTLLRVTLETGRTHQIRAHLLAIGHPVAGDPDYGHAGQTRPEQAIPACRTTRVRAPGNRGTSGSAGATAGGPGQGPPAGVRGTDGPIGVGEPGPTVRSSKRRRPQKLS